jgi:hypothetical protein
VAYSDRKFLTTVFLLLLLAATPASALAGSRTPVATSLAAGHRGDYSWTVKTRQHPGLGLCLSIAISHHHGPFSYDRSTFRDCSPTSALTRSTSPLLAGGTHLDGAGNSKMTVFAILVAPGARRVLLTVSDTPKTAKVIPGLQSLPPGSNRVGGLRVAVVAIPGSHCVERLATESASGRALWQGVPAAHSCAGVE